MTVGDRTSRSRHAENGKEIVNFILNQTTYNRLTILG